MKKILISALVVSGFLAACTKYDTTYDRLILLSKALDITCYSGEMRCRDNNSQMCNADGIWMTWQNCGALGQTCYDTSTKCDGNIGITCCR